MVTSVKVVIHIKFVIIRNDISNSIKRKNQADNRRWTTDDS